MLAARGGNLRATSALALVLAVCASRAMAADVEITTDTGHVDLDTRSGSSAHVAAGVTVSDGVSATAQAWTVTNDGTLNGGNTVTLDQGGTFTNSAGAKIDGSLTALAFGYKPFAQPPAGGPGYLHNYGTIAGTVEGVTMWYGGTVTNYEDGIISTTAGGNAVSVGQGASRVVINSGEIHADATSGYSTAILVQGGPATITNNAKGILTGGYNGVYASGSTPLTFTNDGSITSVRGPAVEAAGGGTFLNTGTIQSGVDGMLISKAATVTNSGTIGSTGAGRAIAFSGADVHTLILGTGSVLDGNVQGGTGKDNLQLTGTGSESIARFRNFETLAMQGTNWALTGAGAFTTSAAVEAGSLRLNGTLTSPAVTVEQAGTLGGNGKIVGAVANKGAIAAGDDGIGTLAVEGSVTFKSGSKLAVHANADEASLLAVTGSATIESGATVSVTAASGSYLPSTTYMIVSTTDPSGRSGTFSGVTSNFAFLTPTLSYDANNVYLTLDKTGIDFDSIGGTPNQRAAGRGVQALDGGNPVYDAVLMLDIDGARDAFDQLSGEIHASLGGLLLDDSRHVREAAFERMRRSLDAGADRPGVWAQGYGADTAGDSDGNAAGFGYRSAGFFAGADGALGDTWRAGGLVGYSRATFDAHDRASAGSADSFHLAAYGGGRWGDFSLRGGAAYAWHSIDTRRSVDFRGFADNLSASYRGHTGQVFGEAAYAFHLNGLTLEPTASLAYVDVGTGGFTEKGDAAALTGRGSSADATFSTLGIRAALPFEIGGLPARATGFVGWRHAFGDTVPKIDIGFPGKTPFAIAGTPIARDAAVVDLGLDIGTGAASRLALTYSGQFGGGTASQGFKAAFNVAF